MSLKLIAHPVPNLIVKYLVNSQLAASCCSNIRWKCVEPEATDAEDAIPSQCTMMPQDEDNTGSTDNAGLTGIDPVVSTFATHLAQFLFDLDVGITVDGITTSPNVTYTLNEIDATTLEELPV